MRVDPSAICATSRLKVLRRSESTKRRRMAKVQMARGPSTSQHLATSTYSRLVACMLCTIFVIVMPVIASAQSDRPPQDGTDHLIIFAGFITAVVALGIYIARGAIFRKEEDYDKHEYASKNDRTGDKYKSSWHDDYAGSSHPEPTNDHYSTLGVKRTATDAEIKLRYRDLAMKHHPDRAGGNADELVRINEAYEVLSDPESRRKYDKLLP